MREITIISGKGGTGKTSITAALASLSVNAVLCDNDVSASDMHLLLKPDIKERHAFEGAWVANINSLKCNSCGICQAHCRFDAISFDTNAGYQINPFLCEGCRLCERVCPLGAIASQRNMKNQWFVSATRFGPFVHAKMGAGEENSGKLVTAIRNKAKEIANQQEALCIINDGPPGIGCPVIASLTGTDIVLVVIEATQSGLHDAKRVIELAQTFQCEILAVINKYDINVEVSKLVVKYLQQKRIPLLAQIPYNKAITDAMIHEKTIVEYAPESIIADKIKIIWNQLIDWF